MMTEIQTWLSDPKRDFSSGVLLFNKYATKQLKTNYGAYFNGLDATKVKAFDSAFNMLINKLTTLNTSIVSNPEAFKAVLTAASPQLLISKQVKEIVALKLESDNLKNQLETQKENATKLDQLKADLTQKTTSLDTLNQQKIDLEKQLDELKTPAKGGDTTEVIQDQITNADQSILKLSEDKKSLSEKITSLEALESDQTKKIKPLQDQIADLDNQLESLTTEKEELNAKLTQIEADNKALVAKVEELNTQIKTLDSDIDNLTEDKEALESQVDELQDDIDEKNSELESLQSDIEEKDSQIEELKSDLESKGLKIVTEEDLPIEMKKKRSRIKEIVPLMAAIHAELSDATLTDEQRQLKAIQLCDLNDERMDLWDSIDEYLSGKDSILAEDKSIKYSDDPIIRGIQIAKRIARLKENIKRNEDAIEKHIKNKKPNFELKARDLVEKYRLELEQLEVMLPNDKG